MEVNMSQLEQILFVLDAIDDRLDRVAVEVPPTVLNRLGDRLQRIADHAYSMASDDAQIDLPLDMAA
jgi:hypothetical protein